MVFIPIPLHPIFWTQTQPLQASLLVECVVRIYFKDTNKEKPEMASIWNVSIGKLALESSIWNWLKSSNKDWSGLIAIQFFTAMVNIPEYPSAWDTVSWVRHVWSWPVRKPLMQDPGPTLTYKWGFSQLSSHAWRSLSTTVCYYKDQMVPTQTVTSQNIITIGNASGKKVGQSSSPQHWEDLWSKILGLSRR